MKNKKLLFGIGALAVVLIAGFLVSGQFLQGAARNARGPATPPAPVTPTVLTFAASPNPVEEDKIVAGDQTASTAVLVARYQVTATGTNSSKVIISNLTIENDYNGQNPLANDAAVSKVYLHFPTSFSNPNNLNGVASAELTPAGYAEFSGLNFRIPGNTPVQFEVRVMTNPIGGDVAVGDQIEMDFSPQQYTAMDRASTIVQGQVLPDGIDGPEFTLVEPAPIIIPPVLTVALGGPTADETVVKGANDVVLASFVLTASNEDVNINSLTVRGYVDQNVDGTFALASEGGADFNDVVVQAHLEDMVGNMIGSPQPFASDGTATFSDMITLTEMNPQTIRVVGDIGMAGVPFGGTNDAVAVDIANISQDVIAVGATSGEPISFSGGNYPNGGSATAKTRMIVVKNSGVITVAPSFDPVLDDKATSPNATTNTISNPLLVARVRIFAQDEAFNVSRMTFIHGNATGAITAVVLKYPTSLSAPTTLDGIAVGTLSSNSVTFNGLNVAVPESVVDENSINVELYVATAGIGMGANSGDRLDIDFDYDANFQAVGLASGTTVTQNSNSTMYGTFANVMGSNNIAIYKSLPTFERHTSSTVCPATTLIASVESNVYCFKVTATAGGAVSLYKLSFDAVPTLLNNGTAAGQLANANGWKLYKYNASGNVQSTAVGSGTWSAATNTVSIILDTVMNSDSTVGAGGTNYYVLRAPVTLLPSIEQSNLSTRLKDDTSHAALGLAAAVFGNNIWSDRSAATHSALSADWTNSYKLEILPTQYFQLTE